jgi:hypothetical protein
MNVDVDPAHCLELAVALHEVAHLDGRGLIAHDPII